MELNTTIQGIPCTVALEYCPECRGARERGSGVQLEPDEPASFEIVGVYKRGGKGRHMQWLEDKMTDEDFRRITEIEAWEATNE